MTSTRLKSAAQRAIELLGGPVKAAKRLNISRYQTVQAWRKTRIPADYCPQIEKELNGEMRCEELRPDVPWEVLRAPIGGKGSLSS